MTTAQLVMLYAAEEGSISGAAERAFVSQQCASAHIRNLEQQYGMALFIRKPSLRLTPAGEWLYETYREMHRLEQSAEHVLREMRDGSTGQLRVGMNSSRARALIPSVLETYGETYPGVRIDFQFGDTVQLIESLRSGALDMIIGIGLTAEDTADLEVTHIADDRVYFLTTEEQAERYCPELRGPAAGETVSLADISRFPLCRNRQGSTLTGLIDRHLHEEGIVPDSRYTISDYDTQLSLCRNHIASCFCPSMLLPYMREMAGGARLLEYPVREITETLSVDLLRFLTVRGPRYEEAFIEAIRKAVPEESTGPFPGGRKKI